MMNEYVKKRKEKERSRLGSRMRHLFSIYFYETIILLRWTSFTSMIYLIKLLLKCRSQIRLLHSANKKTALQHRKRVFERYLFK